MGALHPGMTRASFELSRLELDDGRLVVSGWWSGVRGMRFVRPALLLDGRKMLATLEHKPWAVASDGSWTAAFPWKQKGPLDVSGVTLAVAPSVEVPLDAELSPPAPRPAAARPALSDATPPPEPAPARRRARAPTRTPAPSPVAGIAVAPAVAVTMPAVSAEPETVPRASRPAEPAPSPADGIPTETLHDELRELERRLEGTRDELHDARAIAAERELRYRELERTAADTRRDGDAAETERDVLKRAQAAAVRDRDRARAQHEEAVADREAAVRTRARMEAQRDDALQLRDGAEARRDAAIAERDELRRQRDEVLAAHKALQGQLKDERMAQSRPAGDAADPLAPAPSAHATRRDRDRDRDGREAPSGVRVIPAARTVAAHLHRAERDRGSRVSSFDLWVMRILGSVAAVSFIALLVMILKAFFVF